MNNVCDMPGLNAPAQTASTITQPDESCCIVKLVGGVTATSVVLEKHGSIDNHKVAVLTLPTDCEEADPSSTVSASRSFQLSQCISPPAIEKYVLNSALLI